MEPEKSGPPKQAQSSDGAKDPLSGSSPRLRGRGKNEVPVWTTSTADGELNPRGASRCVGASGEENATTKMQGDADAVANWTVEEKLAVSEIRRQHAEASLEEERVNFERRRGEMEQNQVECLAKLDLLQKWAREVESSHNRVAEEMKKTRELQQLRVTALEDSINEISTQRDDLANLVDKYGIRKKRRMILLTQAFGVLHIFGGLVFYPRLRAATLELLWPGNLSRYACIQNLWEFLRVPAFSYLFKGLSWAKDTPLAEPKVISASISILKDQQWAIWYHAFGLYLLSPAWSCTFGAFVLPFHLPIWAGVGVTEITH